MAIVRDKFHALDVVMNERVRRLWAAAEAKALGWGGISTVAEATGLSRTTIRAGMAELEAPRKGAEPAGSRWARVRRRGGGRARLWRVDATLCQDVQLLVEASTRGDPQSPLLWTNKSTRRLAAELVAQGHAVSHTTVARLLEGMGYSLQAPRKRLEGASHPDRDAQFEHINAQVRAFQARGQPVVSVDTKKKELVGPFRNGGREWYPKGSPPPVQVHDFPDAELGKAIPYGVYDLRTNAGWVSVGITHDTAEFAVETLRRWWQRMGARVYPQARELLITADGGGSNGVRSRLWKVALQGLADELGLRITVCHFPPGTSKWNKIEHRLFCHITENWRGRPLVSRAAIVALIGNTTTRTGLRVNAELDVHDYPTGIEVTDAQFNALRLEKDAFHGEWNYTLLPHIADGEN